VQSAEPPDTLTSAYRLLPSDFGRVGRFREDYGWQRVLGTTI